MKIEELLEICSEQNVKSKYRNLYDPMNWYSLGKNSREYAFFFPAKAKLPVFIDHGINGSLLSTDLEYSFKNSSLIYFACNLSRQKKFNELYKKQCEIIMFPNIYWRRKNNITQSPDAKGTIVYPFHLISTTEDKCDIDKYAEQLKQLPERFHPVTISLHYCDVDRGRHLKWLRHGFEVVSAGHAADDRFAERFYDILRRYKYASSNCIGSHTYYAVEMGIPFFICGEREKYINNGDPAVEKGETDFMKYDWYKNAYNLFSVDNIETDEINITDEQTALALHNCGADGSISRGRFTFLLWKLFIYEYLRAFKRTLFFLTRFA